MSPQPLSANQRALSSATCKGYFKRLLHPTFHLCTQDPTDAKAQACPGDSGSPVMVQRDGALQVAGVVSWGGETERRVCGEGPADVSERVLPHLALLTGSAPKRFAPYAVRAPRVKSGRCDRGRWLPAGTRVTVRRSGGSCVVTARTAGGWAQAQAR